MEPRVSRMRAREAAVKLNGRWQFRIDPSERGETNEWYDPGVDWTDGRTVSVPHSWQEEGDLREYTGAAWYRRTFDFDGAQASERVFLAFDAVDYETTVWINGERVGDNAGGYLPFDVEVTDEVVEGENTVALRVSDPADLSEIPHGKQGDPWYTRVSGPWQGIGLVTVPETYVEDVRVTPDLATDTATVDVSAANAGGHDIVVSVDRDGTTVAEATATFVEGTESTSISLSIPDADYWTPADPALYDIEIRLRENGETVDTYADYFGMRSISREDGDLYLNGEPFTMRGALDQAFYPETYYRPRDLETFEREIRVAKELGFNLLRKHIKPAHPEFLELADRMGILVWEEPANPSIYTERSKAGLRAQLRGLIDRDYNRPSVVVWSLYNEEWGIGGHPEEDSLWEDEEKQDYLESLYEETREWDDTRLVCDNSGWAHVATDVNDYHEYYVAPDRVDAWREKLEHITDHPEENYGDARRDTAVPLVVSEFGTWGLPDISRTDWGEDGDPHWFEHDFLEGLKRPEGVRERFAESHASGVFESLSDIAETWQRREFQSVEPFIADMREHESVAGYVITEFTDIEWEFNGVLDYYREEKSFHGDFARINAPVMLHFDVDSPVVWESGEYRGDVVVANDTDERLDTTVEWSAFGESGVIDVEVDPNEAVRYEDAVVVSVPNADGIRAETVDVTMPGSDQSLSRTAWVVSRPLDDRSRRVFAAHEGLADALDRHGYEVVSDPSDADLSLVTDPDAYDRSNLLVVPEADGTLAETEVVEYTELPRDESWNLCASFIYQDLVPEVGPLPGWAFEGLYPYAYVDDPHDDDVVSVGYLEGWMESEGAIALTRTESDVASVCTLRVTDAYGDHPLATIVLDRLIEMSVRAETGSEAVRPRQD